MKKRGSQKKNSTLEFNHQLLKVFEMIEAISKFLNGYRAFDIRKTEGMEGLGFIAKVMKNGRVLGEVADYGDGAAMRIDFPTRRMNKT